MEKSFKLDEIDSKFYFVITEESIIDLVTYCKLAVTKRQEGNENANILLNCLNQVFEDPILMKRKLSNYFRSIISKGLYNHESQLIDACRSTYIKYMTVKLPYNSERFNFDELLLFQNNSY